MHPNLPNLFVIGAAKSGTTTLHSVLSRHPQVFMTNPKATRFFAKQQYYERGLEWYLKTYFAGAEEYPLRGEATPSYLTSEKTAARIRETIPGDETRFIVIFRNPVDRAYSHYWYNRNTKRGGERISFERALQNEQDHTTAMGGPDPRHSRTLAYFHNGEYSRCLKEYLGFFEPRQFLFLLFEDIFRERFPGTVGRINEFLGIEDVAIPYVRENYSRKIAARPTVRFVRKHRSFVGWLKAALPGFAQIFLRQQYSRLKTKPVEYPPMRPETRRMLLEKYTPGIHELEQIIGRDLSHWLITE
jgi:hypothetical protein